MIEKYAQFREFLDYMREVWVENTSLYKIVLCNHWGNITRTNNSNESYNFRLENRFPKIHPNIWSFIELIQKEEGIVVVKFERINAGTINSKPKKKVDVDRDSNIFRAKTTYLESDKDDDDLEALLSKLHVLVPEF